MSSPGSPTLHLDAAARDAPNARCAIALLGLAALAPWLVFADCRARRACYTRGCCVGGPGRSAAGQAGSVARHRIVRGDLAARTAAGRCRCEWPARRCDAVLHRRSRVAPHCVVACAGARQIVPGRAAVAAADRRRIMPAVDLRRLVVRLRLDRVGSAMCRSIRCQSPRDVTMLRDARLERCKRGWTSRELSRQASVYRSSPWRAGRGLRSRSRLPGVAGR